MIQEFNIDIKITYMTSSTKFQNIFSVPCGLSIIELLERINLTKLIPELKDIKYEVGIYGSIISKFLILDKNTNLEIYRELYQSPKEKRLQRYNEQQNKD